MKVMQQSLLYYNILRLYISFYGLHSGVKRLRAFDIVVVLLTLVGTFLLLTNGSLSKLIVALQAYFGESWPD